MDNKVLSPLLKARTKLGLSLSNVVLNLKRQSILPTSLSVLPLLSFSPPLAIVASGVLAHSLHCCLCSSAFPGRCPYVCQSDKRNVRRTFVNGCGFMFCTTPWASPIASSGWLTCGFPQNSAE